ncbi:MAG: nucleotide exchange factor GrpE [Pseudomonadota bacterium]
MQGDHKQGAETPHPETEAAAAEPAVENSDEALAFEPEREDEPIVALRNEVEETRSHMLRALAEAENVRRRAQRDVADARQYAVTAFARDLLNVSDNFKRALSLVAEDAELPADLKGLVDGVRMTERELSSVFERHGVTITDPTGERFDPNRHQAMFEIENPDVPSGTVLQVVQSGAVIGERTLRPAMVGVSKGGPKPGEAAGPASGEAQPTENEAETETTDGEGDRA